MITLDLTKSFTPGDGVEADPAMAGAYVAKDLDPHLVWRAGKADRKRLSGMGELWLEVRMVALQGRLISPCIYVDWGDGFSETDRYTLKAVEPGVYVASAHTRGGPCRAIRLDPSSTGCHLRISGITLQASVGQGIRFDLRSALARNARRVLRRLPGPAQRTLRNVRTVVSAAPGRGGALKSLMRGPLGRVSDRWRVAHRHAFEVARNLRSPQFAAPPLEPPPRDPEGPRVVAFYLPQFHPIPENNLWWGAGFTEWANVAKATPQFSGHLQPKLPADLGYYDLRVPEVRRAQADLAGRMGVDAFCFHYYWFAGKRLLERPLDAFVDDPTIETPFSICWANENWTRRWDGQEHDILIGQQHSPEDDLAVFDDLARYLRSPRYLKVDQRPVLMIYRPDILPDVADTLRIWRERARALGLGELHILCTNAFGFDNHLELGFDGRVEFPPHAIAVGEITDTVELLTPDFRGRVYDYEAVIDFKVEDLAQSTDATTYPGVMPGWDNEARKPGAGHAFHNATPEGFRRWFKAATENARRLKRPGERLIFVNAWNEWAEGACLEPDRWFGHGYGQAIRSVLAEDAPAIAASDPRILASRQRGRPNDAVALTHIYYPSLIDVLAAHLGPVTQGLDVDITFPSTWSSTDVDRLVKAFPDARLSPEPNLGRDVRPFLNALARAADDGYEVFCKVHSKRSPHLGDGDAWRDALMASLLAPEAVKTALGSFAQHPRLGLMAPAAARVELGKPGVLHNNGPTLRRLAKQLAFTFDDQTPFPAGTMFWGRVDAYKALISGRPDLHFEPEMGRIDGTLAHALERAMGAIPMAAGFETRFTL